MNRKSPLFIAAMRLTGILLFLSLYLAARQFIDFVDFYLYEDIVHFIGDNLTTILLFSVLLACGDVFNAQNFPRNVPAPILNATGSYFLLNFGFSIFQFMDNGFDLGFYEDYSWVRYIIIPGVFIMVLLVGYIKIFIYSANSQKALTGLSSREHRQRSFQKERGLNQQ